MPIWQNFDVNGLNWQCCWATGSSKTAPRIFIFSIVLSAKYHSFYVKSIATYAPTFLMYNISILDIVNCKFLTLRIWILNFSSRKWHYFGLPPNQIMNIFTRNSQTFKPGSGASWNKPMNSILISGKLKVIKMKKRLKRFNNRFLREGGMASTPKMEYQVFLCIFQKNSTLP